MAIFFRDLAEKSEEYCRVTQEKLEELRKERTDFSIPLTKKKNFAQYKRRTNDKIRKLEGRIEELESCLRLNEGAFPPGKKTIRFASS